MDVHFIYQLNVVMVAVQRAKDLVPLLQNVPIAVINYAQMEVVLALKIYVLQSMDVQLILLLDVQMVNV